MVKEIKQKRVDLLFDKFINNENINFLSTGSLLYSNSNTRYAFWIAETLPNSFIIYVNDIYEYGDGLLELDGLPKDILIQKINEIYNINQLELVING